jgi:hypothetical protein
MDAVIFSVDPDSIRDLGSFEFQYRASVGNCHN